MRLGASRRVVLRQGFVQPWNLSVRLTANGLLYIGTLIFLQSSLSA